MTEPTRISPLKEALDAVVSRAPEASQEILCEMREAMMLDKRFAEYPPQVVAATLASYAAPDKKALRDLLTPEKLLGDLKASHTFQKKLAEDVSTKRFVSRFESDLSMAEKVNAGMSFLVAGLSAVGAFSYFRQAVTKDEQGNNHIQPTQLGLGIVMSLLTAGCAYAGVQTMRGGSAR